MSLITTENRINICEKTRDWISTEIANLLRKQNNSSEKQFATAVDMEVKNNPEFQREGWYAPPPSGIAALFSDIDDFDRLRFDTLRKEQYWPQEQYKLLKDSAGILYASPIHKPSGTIGDFGITVYRGNNRDIQLHLVNCLKALEQAAEFAQVGMEFRELHDSAQKSFKENNLHNHRTVTWTDTVGTNLGHTIPWSYEEPTSEEQRIISGNSLNDLRNLISNKRVNVNKNEQFKIPANIAFTLEARLESMLDVSLPNIFFHLIITFKNGHKKVLSNFNNVFSALGMNNYIASKY
jgi:hypothetical protein